MFYISAYPEAHRGIYYEKLNGITQNNNWEEWIGFFLTAVIEQSKANTQKARAMLELYKEMKKEITLITKSKYSIQVLDTIFERPYFSTTEFVKRSAIPKTSAMRITNELTEQSILTILQEGQGKRPALMVFRKLTSIVG